ncbi:MAG TPA: G8 domain-containing protein [Ilumatobacteraceae bacterium]|nr:G8 domain-containing protein [Ilumatobacteraceae bacterium]
MAETPPVPDDREPTKRSYPRREVIAIAGFGGLALLGWQVTRTIGDDAESGAGRSGRRSGANEPDNTKPPKEERERDRKPDKTTTTQPSTTQPTATTTTAPATTTTGHHEGTETTVPVETTTPPPGGDPTAVNWSDPATWGGSVPGATDTAMIDRPVLLDIDATVGGVHIGPNGSLTFDPASSRKLASRGNVVVAGQLTLRPSSAQILHQIEFIEVDESRFVGGHSAEPLATDVGLWVVAAGVLDAHGTPKTAWTNLSGAANKGDSTIDVDAAAGWRVGDEVVITPTESTTVDNHWEHHDRRTVTSVSGARIGLDRPLDFPHPAATVRPGVTHRAEVLNISRNVVIGGTPGGKAHLIMLSTTTAQQISHIGLRNMGPRKGEDEVLGRYAIHFHAGYDGSRGSLLDGVSVYDSTGHGFASHLSNGVTFRDCIAHDMVDDAFWWDLSLDGGGRDLVPSHNIVYERCVASFVKSGGNSKFNLCGFMMGAGDGNIARGCVATGVEGGAESSAGYNWPSLSRDDNTWAFEGNMAHNVRHSGIYFWQNGKPRTLVDGFTAYHCGQGIFAGSYANLVSYHDCTVYACENVGVVISALPAKAGQASDETITYTRMYVDQAGLSDFAVHVTKHLARGGRVTEISDSTFQGGTVAQIGLPDGGDHPQLYDFVNCTFAGNEFWLVDDVAEETVLRVINGTTTYTVRPGDQQGDPRPEWNAVSTDT